VRERLSRDEAVHRPSEWSQDRLQGNRTGGPQYAGQQHRSAPHPHPSPGQQLDPEQVAYHTNPVVTNPTNPTSTTARLTGPPEVQPRRRVSADQIYAAHREARLEARLEARQALKEEPHTEGLLTSRKAVLPSEIRRRERSADGGLSDDSEPETASPRAPRAARPQEDRERERPRDRSWDRARGPTTRERSAVEDPRQGLDGREEKVFRTAEPHPVPINATPSHQQPQQRQHQPLESVYHREPVHQHHDHHEHMSGDPPKREQYEPLQETPRILREGDKQRELESRQRESQQFQQELQRRSQENQLQRPQEIKLPRPQEVQVQRPQEVQQQWPQEIQLQRPQDIHLQCQQEIQLQRPREIQLQRPQEIQLQRQQEIQLQRSQDIQLQRQQEIQLQRPQEIQLQRKQEIQLQRPQEIQLQCQQEIQLQRPQEIQLQRQLEIQLQRPQEIQLQRPQEIQLQQPQELQLQRSQEPQNQQETLGHQWSDSAAYLRKSSPIRPRVRPGTSGESGSNTGGGLKPKVRTRSMSDVGVGQRSAMYRTMDRVPLGREVVASAAAGVVNGDVGSLDTRVSVAQLRHSYLENANRKPEL